MDNVQRQVDLLYKEHFGRLVASLLYSSRDIDPEMAEDIVQDSFSSALIDWRKQGVPSNQIGWVYTVCKHKALNKIKREKRTEGLSRHTDPGFIEEKFPESVLEDHQLKLLFACAHPDLAPKVQVVITLKYVVNLRVESIAKILGMTIDGVDKLLLRARQKIKEEKILLEEPPSWSLKSRLSIVHKIIYLIFNEGYKSFSGKEIVREELCEEALLLNKAIMDAGLEDEDTFALHSLMLFTSARLKSRFDSLGDLLDLERQDRSLWSPELIAMGIEFFNRSHSENISTYHLEASIAYLHSVAKSFDSTDWITVVQLYAKLLISNPNPFVELSYAIALYHSGQKVRAFEILNELQRHPFLSQYYLLNSALGKFYHQEGNDLLARQFLLKAYDQTNFQKEKDFIQRLIGELK